MATIARKGKLRLKSADFNLWSKYGMQLPADEVAKLRVARPHKGASAKVRCGVRPWQKVTHIGGTMTVPAGGTATVDIDGTVTSTSISKDTKHPKVEFTVHGGNGAVIVKLSTNKLWSLSGCDMTVQ